MTDPVSIPLSKLVPWDGNVRKARGADTALAELAASIAAHGLLQSLVVRKAKKGKFAVVAGGRRLQALNVLAADGRIAADYSVNCQLAPADADATEISLAENTVREQMHPADEFEAFHALSEKGLPAADIAARFGTTERAVLQRLKLARVSPVLMQAYRDDETTLECLMAFAVTDDHEAQERLWAAGPSWLKTSARQIRDALTRGAVTAGDRRVRFVTLEAYEAAGGAVRRDLFSDQDDGIFIEDVALLETLAAGKLQETANEVAAQGWQWVEIRPEFESSEWSEYDRVFQEHVPLPDAEAGELADLEREADGFHDLDEELDEEQQARFDAITVRIDELQDRETVWTDEAKAMAGAVVFIDHDGEPEIRCGFVRPGDEPEQPAESRTDDDGTVTEAEVEEGFTLPASLVEILTLHRTAAIGAELINRPDLALAGVVHTVASQVFLHDGSDSTCLQVRASTTSLRHVEGSKAYVALEAAREGWGNRIPGSPDALWHWCLEQDRTVLLDLLAFCMACTVNAVQTKTDNPAHSRFAHAHGAADELRLDMSDWFTPTAANYFGKISKAGILEALREARGSIAPAWTKLKRAELAALAERELTGTGWLPAPLRIPASDAGTAMDEAA